MLAIDPPSFVHSQPRKFAWAMTGSVLFHAVLLAVLPPLVKEASQVLPQMLEVRLVETSPIAPRADISPAPRRAEKVLPPAKPSPVVAAPNPTPPVAAVPSVAEPVVTAPVVSARPAPQLAPVLEAPSYVPPDVRAAYLSNPRPVYPLAARRLGLEGRVVLRAEILENGSCGRIDVAQGSGYEMLDQAALQAVKRWRFTPARRGGEAVAAWAEIPISFKLATDS